MPSSAEQRARLYRANFAVPLASAANEVRCVLSACLIAKNEAGTPATIPPTAPYAAPLLGDPLMPAMRPPTKPNAAPKSNPKITPRHVKLHHTGSVSRELTFIVRSLVKLRTGSHGSRRIGVLPM